MTDVYSNWQDSLNQGLVKRLTRPLRQPGMMKMAMSQRIISRCDRFLNRLPLLNQQMQRWGNTSTLSADAVPIVYAQPVSLTPEQGIQSKESNFQSNTSQNLPSVPIIQRKVDSSQALNLKQVESAIVPEQQQDLSSSNFSEQTTPSLSSENPVVSPQPISSEIPLQAQFIDSVAPSPNPSPSQEEEKTSINQISLSASENLVVSPQPISSETQLSQEFASTSKQPLPIIQAKRQNSSLLSSSLPIVNSINSLASPKQTQQGNYSENINLSQPENLATQISSTDSPIVTAQPLTSQIDLNEEYVSLARNQLNHQNISQQQINKTQNIASLPVVTVASPINSSLKPQSLPLPLANNSPSSNSTSQQPNSSKPNQIISNNNSSSSPRIVTNPSLPTETSVSSMTNQSKAKIDVNAIASKVERKLMRRLVIESERRGKIR
ncbi:MAG: hypothetical protein WA919_15960 [Coleofasciculaceae cyanobacterium]